MKRFRVTLLAVCLLLAWLGYNDLSLKLRNSEPLQLSITDLETHGTSREWINVSDGYQDLMQAINMSGTIEVGSLLVPLKRSADSSEIGVWFETRDPQIVDLFKTYHFKLNTNLEQEKFIQSNKDFIYARRDILGMTADNLVADSNRDKLKELLEGMNMTVSDNVVFISEGKEPKYLRGLFFSIVALIGIIKLATSFRSSGSSTPETSNPPEA